MGRKSEGQSGSSPRSPSAEILKLGLAGAQACTPDDLRAQLEYHLAAPLQFELGSANQDVVSQVRTTASADGLLLKSLRDLLEHPRPPLVLLQSVKDFTKACSEYPDSPLPCEVGRVLYYTAIAATWLNWQVRLSKLTDNELATGIHWSLAQPWLDETCRKIFTKWLEAGNSQPTP